MLAQIRKMGAIVVPFAAKADRWDFLAEGAERHGWFVTSPFRAPAVGSHPAGIAGYKTLAFEIVEQMQGAVPDWRSEAHTSELQSLMRISYDVFCLKKKKKKRRT